MIDREALGIRICHSAARKLSMCAGAFKTSSKFGANSGHALDSVEAEVDSNEKELDAGSGALAK